MLIFRFSGVFDKQFLLLSADSARRRHSSRFIDKAVCRLRSFGVDIVVDLVAIVLEYTFPCVVCFSYVACAVGGVTRGACFS